MMYLRMTEHGSTTGFYGEALRTHTGYQYQSSRLSALRPFISADGLIRIGGQLANATLSFSKKYPILLAKNSHLSLLLVRRMYSHYMVDRN